MGAEFCALPLERGGCYRRRLCRCSGGGDQQDHLDHVFYFLFSIFLKKIKGGLDGLGGLSHWGHPKLPNADAPR
jgi:hypothetical protein